MRVIVIGTGIVGASAAYELAKNNVEVVMIDRPEDGKATSAGAGIVCPWVSSVDNEDWYAIAKRVAAFYPQLIEELKEDGEKHVGYKKVGALCVSTDIEHLSMVENSVREKRKSAPEAGEITRLNVEEAKKLFPPLREDFEAVHISGAARVDGRLLCEALKRAAVKHGAQLIEGEASLVCEKRKVTGVKVSHDTITGDHVLITAGAWAPELLKPLGITLKVEPQRGQIAHITLPEEDTSGWPVILPESSHYMLAFDDSRVVAGATRETGSGFDYRLTAGGVEEVLSEALTVAPGLSEGTLQEVRIGFRPMGPDNLPIIGQIDSLDQVTLATGLGASGLTMGPYVGKLAAALATENDPVINLAPYDPARVITESTKV